MNKNKILIIGLVVFAVVFLLIAVVMIQLNSGTNVLLDKEDEIKELFLESNIANVTLDSVEIDCSNYNGEDGTCTYVINMGNSVKEVFTFPLKYLIYDGDEDVLLSVISDDFELGEYGGGINGETPVDLSAAVRVVIE